MLATQRHYPHSVIRYENAARSRLIPQFGEFAATSVMHPAAKNCAFRISMSTVEGGCAVNMLTITLRV
jgi:hypothetical protein